MFNPFLVWKPDRRLDPNGPLGNINEGSLQRIPSQIEHSEPRDSNLGIPKMVWLCLIPLAGIYAHNLVHIYLHCNLYNLDIHINGSENG